MHVVISLSIQDATVSAKRPTLASNNNIWAVCFAAPQLYTYNLLPGYLVEHRRTGSPHWVRSAPQLVAAPELTLAGLEPGWRYQFRVSAQNAAGLSDPGELSDLLTVTLQRTAASAPFFVKELADTVALENEKVSDSGLHLDIGVDIFYV